MRRPFISFTNPAVFYTIDVGEIDAMLIWSLEDKMSLVDTTPRNEAPAQEPGRNRLIGTRDFDSCWRSMFLRCDNMSAG